MSYELVCVRGSMKDRRWSIASEGLKIGRAEACEIRIADAAVELFHCVVKLDDGKPVVLNLASDKGVNVNGSYVAEAELDPTDVICVGNDWFVVAATDGGKGGGSGARVAAASVALLLALVAAAFVFWRKGQSKPPAIPPPPVATNAVTQVEAPVTTNRVVRIVGEEIVVTNRIVRIVDNVVVTNYVVVARRADGSPAVAGANGDNGYVNPEPTDGLVLSEDGKTLVSVPQRVSHVVIPQGVTTIGDKAFEYHKSLELLTIPPSVTKFGHDAFRGCNKLVGVIITDLAAWCRLSFVCDDEAFGWANDNPIAFAHNLYLNGLLVRDMEIPPGVTRVGNNAFRGCSLSSATIPRSVREIGPGAFGDCSNLAKFSVDAANRRYKSVDGLLLTKDGRTLVSVPGGLEGVTIPQGVLNIGDRAFAGCSKLSKLTIPDGVTSIGYKAFKGCKNLKNIWFPPSMEKIEHGAFEKCDNLADVYIADLAAWCRMSVDESSSPLDHACNLYLNGELVKDMKIPVGVTRIEKHVFRGCASLTCVTIPQSVEYVGEGAFANCGNLAEFRVAGGNYHYKDDVGLLMTRDGKTLVATPGAIANVKIPGGTEVIGSLAFGGCSRLVDVKIPDGVTRISYKAFDGCKSLVSVEIPNSVKSMGNWGALGGCPKLASITIPGSVERIGAGSFAWDGKLANVVIQDGVKRICRSAFESCPIKSITIPDSVTSIESEAFGGCKQLESVTIPEGLTNIHERAFVGCNKLLDANKRPRLTRVPSAGGKTKTGHPAK